MKLFGASLFTLTIMSSFVCVVILLVLLYLDNINIGFAIGLTVGINFLLWLIGPFITDWLSRWFYKVKFLSHEELESSYPEVAEVINKVCREYKFKPPKVGIIPDQNPTAYTYGSARFNARIILTEGIYHYLNHNEIKAVVAHEMGHVVNRDFIVMMIASTLVQVLYEIYAVLIRAKGKKSGNAKLIALVAYGFYIVSTYMLYYLSRTRETLADEFSAKVTSPQDLANGLIKIAYGIVAAEDDDSTKRLLESTRHLGVVDVKNAKHIGAVSYITHNDPKILAEVMVFDRISPWAKLIELSSTHPLTGNRLSHLSNLSKKLHHSFSYNIDEAIQRLRVNTSKLWTQFSYGVIIYFLPVILFFGFLFTLPFELCLAGLGLGMLIQLAYKYPFGQSTPTTILDEMRDPYASPIHGKPILLEGKVVGRGIPGYIFSEDMMYQDKTGITFLDYNSYFGFIGNWFFALKKLQDLLNITSKADGWFFRGMSSMVALKYIETSDKKVRSHPIIWSIILPVLLIGLSIYLYYIGLSTNSSIRLPIWNFITGTSTL